MEENNKQKQIEDIEAELRELHSNLCFSDEYGDWKIIKYHEYISAEKEPPYNIEELSKKRQKVRDRINYLQNKLQKIREG